MRKFAFSSGIKRVRRYRGKWWKRVKFNTMDLISTTRDSCSLQTKFIIRINDKYTVKILLDVSTISANKVATLLECKVRKGDFTNIE